jgi:hypothetical protein
MHRCLCLRVRVVTDTQGVCLIESEGETRRERGLWLRVRAKQTDGETASVKCGTTYMLKIKFSLRDVRRYRCGVCRI